MGRVGKAGEMISAVSRGHRTKIGVSKLTGQGQGGTWEFLVKPFHFMTGF